MAISTEGSNRIFQVKAVFPETIRVDQSIAHDGVCLTVTDLLEQEVGQQVTYSVTAVDETLQKTALGNWEVGKLVNLERCMRVGDRLDGHFVQGHVDNTGIVQRVEELDGSWIYEFGFSPDFAPLLVDKGSICVNGVSLTVVKAGRDHFTVTIIPFTYTHTNFHQLAKGQAINLEFDILGKYLLRQQQLNQN